MALAYGLGAVGSLMGALLAFATVSHTRSLPSTMAAKCVSATAATYIGGTVNFFQVGQGKGTLHLFCERKKHRESSIWELHNTLSHCDPSSIPTLRRYEIWVL